MRKPKHKIAVIGAGNMGVALAQVMAEKRHKVALWNYDSDVLRKIEDERKCKFLRAVKLSDNIIPVDDINDAVRHAEMVILAVSSPYVRQVARLIAPSLKPKTIVVNVAKGIEARTKLCMIDVIEQEIPKKFHKRITELSGPTLANELVEDVPTAAVIASRDKTVFPVLRKYLRTSGFRLATSEDIYGATYAGLSKNAYAIALGICEGLKMKSNAKAWMAAVALDEMTRFVEKMGGEREMVYGLAGLGDLLVSGFGSGRNRQYGVNLAGCKKKCRASKKDIMTVEGIEVCRAMMSLAKKKKLKLPLLEMLYAIMFRGKAPKKAMDAFFANIRLK